MVGAALASDTTFFPFLYHTREYTYFEWYHVGGASIPQDLFPLFAGASRARYPWRRGVTIAGGLNSSFGGKPTPTPTPTSDDSITQFC